MVRSFALQTIRRSVELDNRDLRSNTGYVILLLPDLFPLPEASERDVSGAVDVTFRWRIGTSATREHVIVDQGGRGRSWSTGSHYMFYIIWMISSASAPLAVSSVSQVSSRPNGLPPGRSLRSLRLLPQDVSRDDLLRPGCDRVVRVVQGWHLLGTASEQLGWARSSPCDILMRNSPVESNCRYSQLDYASDL